MSEDTAPDTTTDTDGEPDADADRELSWREEAAVLADHGVPERRAEVVALAARGFGPTAIADRLGVSSRGSIVNQLQRYREQRENAAWLAEHGPDV